MSYNSTLDSFCGTPFWNSTATWYTDNPELTPCFQQTVLIWTPCLYLWVFAFLDLYYIFNSKERNIPWNILNITKLLVTCLLIVLKFVDLGVAVHLSSNGEKEVYNANYYSPVIKILTFGLSATLLFYNRKYGMRASGVLFFFWLLLVVAGIPQLRSEIIDHKNLDDDENVKYNFISYMVYYPLIVLMFILNCFADLPPKDTPYKYQKNQCPENAAGFPSRLTFSWFDPLALTGFRRSLVENDLWALNPPDSSKECVPKFDKFWERSLKKRELSNGTKATYRKTSASVNFKPENEKKPASILPALCLAFGGQFLFGSILKLINDILMFISPQLLKLLISFVKNDEPDWKGYAYAVALLLCAITQTMLLAHYFTRMYLVGMRIRTALTSAIYRKSLRLSNSARKESTVGEIVNLMSVDAQRFVELTAYLNMIWSAPLQIALALYFLWAILGPSVLAGLAVMIILIPVNGLIANRVKTLQIKQMKYKDERVKLMNEVLNGIKVLKMYAWEPSFEDQILQIRNKEMHVLKQTAYLNSATSFIWSCAPFLTSVGIKRLNKFMNCDELDISSVDHDKKEPSPIVIENGNFTWGEKDADPVLKNINLNVPRGSLVAIVGAVGSGKSSLLAAMLGEMNKISGRVNTHGSIAYVPQQAWIQNATLQDNILFGKPLQQQSYNNVINVCALKPDFDVLPGGDQTEIGEKGINLSGGQKQRVSLARAVYHEADNYLLDDPLSAVDSHVGKHIFDKVIGPAGLLKDRTRVWVTHNVSYLAQTDLVVVLRDGQVSEAGSYQHLLEKKGAFADFLLHHLSDIEKTSPDELDVLKQDLETKLGTEFQNKLQRARSLSESTSESEQTPAGDRAGSVKQKTPDALTQSDLKEKNKLIEAEKAETGSVKWSIYKHYLMSVGVFASVVTILMNLILQVFQVGSNYWLAEWSSDSKIIVNGTVDRAKRDMYLGVYGALGAGQVLSVSVSSLALYLGTLAAARALHATLLAGVLRAPSIGFFDCTPVGRVLNRFSKDVDVLDNTLPMTLRGWTSCFFSVLGTLFVISVSTPLFLVIVVPVGLIYYVIQRFYVATSRQLKRLESISRSPIYSHFGESITGASTIRAYGVTDRFIEESESRVDHNQSCYYPSCIANRWLAIRLEMIGNFIIFSAAVFAVLGRNSIYPGIVGLSISYALQITQTLNWLVRMTSEVETNIVAVERIKEYAETEQEAAWNLEKGPGATWPETGALQLEQLTLEYRPGEPALRDVTCTVAPRDKLGIVGRTGAGKSTLTLGLFRIVEAAAGRILIDGVDIATLGLHQLRSRITIIPQEPILFSGTLRSNLDPFEAYSDEEIWRALEHAHLRAFVQGLPAGLRHEVAEGGENLSVGQRQLVCLARALLRKTPLLVLDEATAAVDLETDDLIQKTIRSEFASCTVLTIAHRLNTIMDSTKVMVLDRGQLVEYAAPQQLLNDKNSIFYSMAKDAGIVN
ncbi:multidrug resistance-associated protein 1 isoform X4 [Bombyx mandarina]|uniref:ABC-type glutathione-S-conjugate transporter n=1 Tax=Bombyx mandarina TaxID=7092 RepID=A0A6J2JXW6_BOMMA|nr:multidrug resistance-associated protein 1 isoform X4 [Bombyx mandarina]